MKAACMFYIVCLLVSADMGARSPLAKLHMEVLSEYNEMIFF